MSKKPITRIGVLDLMAQLNIIPSGPAKNIENLFIDVTKNNHHKALLQLAYEGELITPDKYFYPNQFVTRAELATMLTRFPQVRKLFSTEAK